MRALTYHGAQSVKVDTAPTQSFRTTTTLFFESRPLQFVVPTSIYIAEKSRQLSMAMTCRGRVPL